eukprot:TRINITY_DN4830_c0_g2_i1.p1 TRINITY_DN4830_c0_g2~~TRINITY_DN4830_c0_g2_i1.p1  ORF type:complete len:192 (+),score=85.27 TRINITY_DN4830_c0_g2_i1:613-1188(+)
MVITIPYPPQINPANIKVEWDDKTVNIVAEQEGLKLSHSLSLPFQVKGEEVSANFEDGKLKLVIPTPEQNKPKSIPVQIKKLGTEKVEKKTPERRRRNRREQRGRRRGRASSKTAIPTTPTPTQIEVNEVKEEVREEVQPIEESAPEVGEVVMAEPIPEEQPKEVEEEEERKKRSFGLLERRKIFNNMEDK